MTESQMDIVLTRVKTEEISLHHLKQYEDLGKILVHALQMGQSLRMLIVGWAKADRSSQISSYLTQYHHLLDVP